jgi:hypothetical protein
VRIVEFVVGKEVGQGAGAEPVVLRAAK